VVPGDLGARKARLRKSQIPTSPPKRSDALRKERGRPQRKVPSCPRPPLIQIYHLSTSHSDVFNSHIRENHALLCEASRDSHFFALHPANHISKQPHDHPFPQPQFRSYHTKPAILNPIHRSSILELFVSSTSTLLRSGNVQSCEKNSRIELR